MELPEQLVFMILTWLPVKSLLRFKSVCKSWYALIESSYFVNEHLFKNNNCSSSPSSSLFSSSSIMIRNTDSWDCYSHTEFVWLSGDKFENCVDTFHLNFFEDLRELNIYLFELTFTNSCNGIICLQIRDNVALWNPAIDQFRPLPSPLTSSSHFTSKLTINTLLGFDVRTQDYKVVMFIRNKGENPLSRVNNKPDSQVLVYNLSTDSWRTIYKDILLPFESFCYGDSKLVYKNGICFWIGTNKTPTVICDSEDELVSFDFSTEVIRTIPIPQPDTNHYYVKPYALDFLDENIVCINRLAKREPIIQGAIYKWSPSVNELFDIWMFHGYGVKESWTKLYTLGPFPISNIFPIRFSKNRDFLLLSKQGGRLFLYNLVTQEMQDIYGSYRELVFYNESLVSIKGVNAAANPRTNLFANMWRYGYESEEEDDETGVKSDAREEVEEDMEDIISNELDVGLKLEFEPSSSK